MAADFYQYTRAAGRLAQGDSSTAVTFNMHNIIMATFAEVDESTLAGNFGKRMADFRNWVFALMPAKSDESLCHPVASASLINQ
jgi:hypothetical protein